MFEITGDHIAELSDEDLRSLIGMLCEAEMRRRDLPVSVVTWGGNQNAKDAGLDVRVSLPATTQTDGFIPKPSSGFQVKKSDMPRSAILDEMRPKPKGVIRPSIAALAEESGAYIIVSGDGSASDSALKDRREAMAEAMQGVPHADKLVLEFLDRGRVATWVRDHAAIITWVRKKIGKAIPGWHPYGTWSHTPDAKNTDYLADDAARIRTGTQDEGDGLSAIEGINRIRDVLRTPGKVVRLVGLSGVGKTRFVEALFDGKIGDNPLDPALAAYADVANTPDPPPSELAANLLAENRRMILVIDNCPPDLHRKLSEIVRVSGSKLSVITVEYDIREDQPEGTDVFSLEASSTELIEKLVARRFPQLSQIDCSTVAKFSGGNARIAIALAGTVEKDETVAGLSDEDLFRRLFHQRHQPDETLLLIGQACALVYSFQGEDLEGDNAELPILSGLIGKTADEMYRGVDELRSRDLMQRRGVWRAVLPHAVANRLAAMALRKIPPQRINTAIINGKSERLLRSFSRRLGYLDTSEEACTIVAAWLAPGGLLFDVLDLDELGKAIFHNVAPVMPELVLSALEREIGKADAATLERSKNFISLIRLLAFDPKLFERSTALLLRFHAIGTDSHVDKDAGNVIVSFGHIYLSGTHATIEQRLALIESLLRSPDAKQQALGVESLDAVLQTDHFSSSYLFEFGARSRDHGYYPRSDADITHWFGSALKLVETIAASDLPVVDGVKKSIAGEFRGLWANAQLGDELDKMARAFAGNGFWRDGWIATRQARAYDSKRLSPESLAKLKALEEFLRPKDLVAKVRGIVLEAKGGGLGYDELDDAEDLDKYDYDAAEKRTAVAIERLGKDLAVATESLQEILPELVSGNGHRLFQLGSALAWGADEPRLLWEALLTQLAATQDGNPTVMGGFLSGLQALQPDDVDAMLDDALTNPALVTWFPYLQASVHIDDSGIARIHRSLELGRSPIERYSHLAWGRASDPIPGPAFRDLVAALTDKDGLDSAMHMVSMRLVSDRTAKREPALETLEAGRHVLSKFELGNSKRQVQREDHELGSLAKACLAGKEGEVVVRRLTRMLKEASADYTLRAHDYDDLVNALFVVQPIVTLDEMFTGDEASVKAGIRFVEKLTRRRASPLDGVPPSTLIGWCQIEPDMRYPILGVAGSLFASDNHSSPRQWTPLGPLLLRNAPNPTKILATIVKRLYPNSWGGSWATEMEGRFKLLEQLDVSASPDLQNAKSEALARMRTEIEGARKKEAEEERQRSARFE
ncbi:hypothetical protein J6500_15950 [Bradyrhizobium sp. WSM 1704]|uniref:hypothetical protein n=1 Tax=Bradyrhizobium semiaridum TaxID=2821404 RepID=UPI001CE3A7B8|nr:hypothetical protein [Bradyrhizobium semiaridum]MCA6123378.1 hypothetical protein [Bradyrhizobium semiaridum]